MGTPINNVLSGNTNGTIVTHDYTSDFQAISTALGNLDTTLKATNTQLGTLNTNIGTLNTSITTSIGAAGVATLGSVSYSSDAAVGWLAGISDTLGKMWDQQGKTVSALGQIHLATASAASAANESVAVQQIVAADQMSTNEFNKSATKEALARNGIPAPQPRPITQIIQEKVQEATTINATAAASAFVEDKLTRGVTRAATFGADLFAQSAVGEYLSKKWDSFTDVFKSVDTAIDKSQVDAQEKLAISLAAKRAKP
jgi:hypothetical protein